MSVLGNLESDQLKGIARRFGIVSVKLFGSRAKGTANSSSDYDFLVRFDRVASLVDIIGFKQEIELLLGKSVDVIEEEGIPPTLKDKILSEAIAI